MSFPRILIVNIHSSQNAGDRALLECTIQQLRTNFDRPKIALMPNWPHEEYFLHSGFEVIPSPWDLCGLNTRTLTQQLGLFLAGVTRSALTKEQPSRLAKVPQGWERLFAVYRQADLVVGVAGNQFYSTGRYGWPFPVNVMAVYLAHKFNKPFYTMPQSVGPLRRGWEKKLLGGAYSRARFIQVRDELSQELIQTIGVPGEGIFYAPDPAFDYPPTGTEQAIEFLKDYGYSPGSPSIGVSIISSMGRTLPPGRISGYYRVMANGLRNFIEANSVKVYLFNQVSGPTSMENDRLGSSKIARMLGDFSDRVVNVDTVLPPALLKACYGLMDFFVASRLHSGIFALGMNVPTLFIGYLAKTRGVLRSLGLEDWVIDLENFSEEVFLEKLRNNWEARQLMHDRLIRIMPGVKFQVQQAGQRIAEDYERRG